MFQFNGWDKLNLKNLLFRFVHEMDHQFSGLIFPGRWSHWNKWICGCCENGYFEIFGLFPVLGFFLVNRSVDHYTPKIINHFFCLLIYRRAQSKGFEVNISNITITGIFSCNLFCLAKKKSTIWSIWFDLLYSLWQLYEMCGE